MAAVLAGACGGNDGTGTRTPSPSPEGAPAEPTPVGTVTVSKSECTLEGVEGPIGEGIVSFTATNETSELAYLDMAEIPQDHAYREVVVNIAKATESAERGGREIHRLGWLGWGPQATLAPGATDSLTGVVRPGTYGIVCLRWYPQVDGPRPNGVAGPVEVE